MTHNCWEATDCARDGSCSAYPNDGRNCYAVTGTLCRGIKQRTYMDKIVICRDACGFYRSLMETMGVEIDRRGG